MGSIERFVCWVSPVGIYKGFPLEASSKGFFGGLLLTFDGPEGCMLVAMVVHRGLLGVCWGQLGYVVHF